MQKRDMLVSGSKTAMEKRPWATDIFARGSTRSFPDACPLFRKSQARPRRYRGGRGRLRKLHWRMNASGRLCDIRSQEPRSGYADMRASSLSNTYKGFVATNPRSCHATVRCCTSSSSALTWQLPARHGASGQRVRRVSHKLADVGIETMDMALQLSQSTACKSTRVKPQAAITQAVKTSYTLLWCQETGTTSLQKPGSHSSSSVARSWVRFEHHLIVGLALFPPLEQSPGILHMRSQYGCPSSQFFYDVYRTRLRLGFEHHLTGVVRIRAKEEKHVFAR